MIINLHGLQVHQSRLFAREYLYSPLYNRESEELMLLNTDSSKSLTLTPDFFWILHQFSDIDRLRNIWNIYRLFIQDVQLHFLLYTVNLILCTISVEEMIVRYQKSTTNPDDKMSIQLNIHYLSQSDPAFLLKNSLNVICISDINKGFMELNRPEKGRQLVW